MGAMRGSPETRAFPVYDVLHDSVLLYEHNALSRYRMCPGYVGLGE
jgi:hypothetical protein